MQMTPWIVAKNEEAMQNVLSKVAETTEWLGLKLNAKKCAALHIDCEKAKNQTNFVPHPT